MADLISVVFGSRAALQTCTELLSKAVEQEASDGLLDKNRTARAIVFSKLSMPASANQSGSRIQSQGEQQHALDDEAESTWGGKVTRVNRDHLPPRRLQDRFWHPTRSMASGDHESFVDNFRFFLESCDIFGGIHAFIEETESHQASILLQELGDEFIGMQSFRRKSMVYSFLDHNRFVSPSAAASVATLGPIVTCYVPLLSETHLVEASSAINLLTLPHREEMDGLRLDMFTNLQAVCDVPGDIAVLRMSTESSETGMLNFGMPTPSSKTCWGRLTVLSIAAKKSDVPADDWNCIFKSATRRVSLKKQPLIEDRASLTVDSPCVKWTEGLHTVLKSRAGAEYARLIGIESDVKEEMVEVLSHSFQSLDGELHYA